MTSLWRQFHRQVGFWLGLWFVWLGLTGFLLAWGPLWEEWYRPHLNLVAAPSWEGRLQASLAAVSRSYPEHPVRRLDLPRYPGRSLRFTLDDKRLVYVDPGTAAVLGELRPEQTLRGRILPLHELGEPVLPWLALLLSLVLLSGWLLQLPRPSLVLRLVRRGGWRRALDLHRLVGWLASPPLVLTLATGAVLSNSKWFETSFGSRPYPKVKLSSPAVFEADLDQLVGRSQEALPEAVPTRLHWPGKPEGAFEVRLRQVGELNPYGRSYVHLHPARAEVLQVDNAMQQNGWVRCLHGSYTVHAGYYGGGALVVALLGLVPPLLWVSGARLRWRR